MSYARSRHAYSWLLYLCILTHPGYIHTDYINLRKTYVHLRRKRMSVFFLTYRCEKLNHDKDNFLKSEVSLVADFVKSYLVIIKA